MISVIIPTYNRSAMLMRAVKSILEQTYKEIEIIIVDDGSTDGTQKAVEELAVKDKRIRYYKNLQSGPGSARRQGYRESSGEYVVFMDDDDYYTWKYFFSSAMEVFGSNKGLDLAFAAANADTLITESNKTVSRKMNIKGFLPGLDYLENISDKYDKPKSTFTAVFQRDMLDRAGILEMYTVNDASIYMRALLAGNAFIMQETAGIYVVNGGNISKTISCEFLLENFEEKKWVRDRMAVMLGKQRAAFWWSRQVKITLGYYVAGTSPALNDVFRVKKWIEDNSEGYHTKDLKNEICGILLKAVRRNIGVLFHTKIRIKRTNQ